MTPFEVISNLQSKDRYLTDDEIEQFFVPWVIAYALSNVKEYTGIVSELNKLIDLPKKVQYMFLYHGLPSGRKYGKWEKKTKRSEELDLIKQYYKCSIAKAIQVFPLIKELDLMPTIREELTTGGLKR